MDASDAFHQHRIPILKGENYRQWKADVEVLLMDRDCWGFVEGSEPSLEASASAKERRDYQRRKNKAYTTIYLSIEERLRPLIGETKDGKEAWEILRDNFEPSTRARLAALIDEFFEIRYRPEADTMGEYVSRITSATKRLENAGFKIPDLLVSFQMIRRLPSDYEGLVQLLYRVSDAEFSSTKVQEALLAEYGRVELRRKDKTDGEVSGAMALGTNRKTRNWQKTGKHVVSGQTRKGESESTYTKQSGTCFNCGKKGHFARACPSRGTKEANKMSKGNDTETEDINGAFYVSSTMNAIAHMETEKWIIDTAASDHFCGQREWFHNYKETPQNTALGATEKMSAAIMGMGDIRLQTRTEGKK